MNASLHHRGPDDRGVSEYRSKTEIADFEVCLGNTRLAIIDTSTAGHQPMIDEQTRLSITYNGETYNFRELRSEIGDHFGQWRSTTDTEVVLRAYRKWGLDAFKRLRGMFAVAIWDQAKHELILARDQFGIKPLYYFISTNDEGQPNRLAFSSEVRALLASGLVPRRLSSEAVASYLSYGSIQGPLTIVEGVKAVVPGECLIIRPHNDRLDIQTVSMKSEARSRDSSFRTGSEAAAVLREQLEQSVSAHLVSDVPLGVFLSGGMDSSALVALMSNVTKERPKTFSVVFDDDKLSETRHSRLVADKFQTIHQEILLSEGQLLGLLPDAIQSFDQPSMDGVNTYVVSKAVKEAGVTVALSGLGGDELFAGYPSFRRAMQMNSASPAAKRILRAASAAGKLGMNGSVRRNKFWQLAASGGTAEEVYRITRQLFDPKTVAAIGGSVLHEGAVQFENSSDPVNDVSKLELNGYMANTLLRDTDSMSMAHSLEVRVPFVDVDVAQFAMSVPGRMKLNGGRPHISKPLLAEAIADLLPRELLSRRKMGFTLPFESWMKARLRTEISTVLLDSDRLNRIGLDSDAVGNVWKRFLKSAAAVGWSRPWSLYVLAKWCEVNGVRAEGNEQRA